MYNMYPMADKAPSEPRISNLPRRDVDRANRRRIVLGPLKESKSNSKRFLRAPELSSAKLIGKLLPRTAMHGHS